MTPFYTMLKDFTSWSRQKLFKPFVENIFQSSGKTFGYLIPPSLILYNIYYFRRIYDKKNEEYSRICNEELEKSKYIELELIAK